MASLEIKKLNFAYPVQDKSMQVNALTDIDLSIGDGEFVLICGPSGCGKSTLLRQIKPALRPFGTLSGSISLDGRPINELSFREQTESIGFVMQDPEMQIVTDKVWHELAFGLESLGFNNTTMRMRVAETADFFGIQNYLDSKTSEISGGQKQLLCLASVMAMQPKLILLDEPTSQLDPIAAGEFFSALKRVNDEIGTTIIITEHRYEGLFQMISRVVFMDNGRIICNCKPAEAISQLKTFPRFIETLPASMRLYACLDINGNDAPITVKEGRSYLEKRTPDNLKLYENINRNLQNKHLQKNSGGDSSHNRMRNDRNKLSGRATQGGMNDCKTKRESRKPIITLKDCWFRYERNSSDVLKGLSFSIYKDELTCIIGGNGSGKTTAIMTAAGLYQPYRGKVKLYNKNVETYSKDELFGKKIALLVQNPACCFVKDTVREELINVCKQFKIEKARLDEVISFMELQSFLYRHPYDISGGELQRAAIARLLLPSPEVIFLDEATKGMDPFFKKNFGKMLKGLTANGVSIVLVSHDIEFCAEFADHCAMFFDGRITAEGSSREVLIDNSFYTTAANRISRGIIESALTVPELIERVKMENEHF